MLKLEDIVEIAGETVRKERFGMASMNNDHKTFTGDVLYTSQKGNNFSATSLGFVKSPFS